MFLEQLYDHMWFATFIASTMIGGAARRGLIDMGHYCAGLALVCAGMVYLGYTDRGVHWTLLPVIAMAALFWAGAHRYRRRHPYPQPDGTHEAL